MLPDDRIRLQHMLDATQAAIGFLRARDRLDLDTDTMLLFATVRALDAASLTGFPGPQPADHRPYDPTTAAQHRRRS